MKLTSFLSICLGLMVITSCSSDSETPDLPPTENQKLLKRVLIEFNGQTFDFLTFDYQNNSIERITSPDFQFTYTYEDGLLTFEEQYDYNFQTQEYDIFDEQTTFQYNNSILETDMAVFDLSTGDSNNHKYTLNGQGKILRYDYYQNSDDFDAWPPPGGSRYFNYQGGNIVLESQTNSSDDEQFRIEWTFDQNKNPFSNVNVQSNRQIWPVDLSPMSNNNALSRISYDNNNQLVYSYSYTYEYDEDGYPTKRTEFNILDDEVEEVLIFEYQ